MQAPRQYPRRSPSCRPARRTRAAFKQFATEFDYDEKNLAASSLERDGADRLVRHAGQRPQRQLARAPTCSIRQKFPDRAIRRDSLAKSAKGVEAVGKLTLHGVTKDLRIPLADPAAHRRPALELSGETTIKRLDFGVGQGEWKSTESVGDDIKLQYKVALTMRAGNWPWRMSSSMRRVWIGVSLAVAVLSFYPAWIGRRAGGLPGIAFALFLVFRSSRGCSPGSCASAARSCRSPTKACCAGWRAATASTCAGANLREVSIVVTQGVNLSEEYFFVLAGAGTSGVLVGQQLATRHDLLSHLSKLPGFDHRNIATAMALAGEPALHAVARGAARRRGARDIAAAASLQ